MSPLDVEIMSKYLEYNDVQSWCHTRQIMLAVLKPYLKNKRLTAQELWHLPIDDDILAAKKERQKISNEDVEWFNNIRKQMEGK